MMRRAFHLLFFVSLLWFANASLWNSVSNTAPRSSTGAAPHLAQGAEVNGGARSASSLAGLWQDGASTVAAGPTIVLGPALPAAVVTSLELQPRLAAVRDLARGAVPVSSSSEHARRERHLASVRAALCVHRLDALWRADAQRTLTIPQYATAPPLIG